MLENPKYTLAVPLNLQNEFKNPLKMLHLLFSWNHRYSTDQKEFLSRGKFY